MTTTQEQTDPQNIPVRPQKEQRRADVLRVPLKSGREDFVFRTKNYPRWTIDEIAEALLALARLYEVGKVGCRKRTFTKAEVICIFHWILYKRCPPWPNDQLIARLSIKQAAFIKYLLGPEAFGNATRAARLAGYRHPKQRGYELLRGIRKG